jgi:hypothetical protein
MTREQIDRFEKLGETAWSAFLKYESWVTPQTRALAREFRTLFQKVVVELRK